MEYLEDTQYFYEDALSGVVHLDAGEIPLMRKVMNLLWKKGSIQITIYPLQCMLEFHNIKSKILMLISSRKIS